MKAYTDLEQSKKLAEILPKESADMYYFTIIRDYPYSQGKNKAIAKIMDGSFSSDYDTPAWSLAALLDVIQDDIKIEKTLFDQSDLFTYSILSDTFDYRTYEHEELIDACVEMIEKLKEKELI